VVDTDTYAGHFERELVAHMTGHVGDCGVGDALAAAARAELPSRVREWADAHVVKLPAADEQRCCRPAGLVPTPGWFNTGLGDHFPDGTSTEVVRAAYEKAARAELAYRADGLERQRASAIMRPDIEAIDAALVEAREWTENLLAQGPGRYAAYLSVAVWLAAPPPEWVVKTFKERAWSFQALPSPKHKPHAITGFRYQFGDGTTRAA